MSWSTATPTTCPIETTTGFREAMMARCTKTWISRTTTQPHHERHNGGSWSDWMEISERSLAVMTCKVISLGRATLCAPGRHNDDFLVLAYHEQSGKRRTGLWSPICLRSIRHWLLPIPASTYTVRWANLNQDPCLNHYSPTVCSVDAAAQCKRMGSVRRPRRHCPRRVLLYRSPWSLRPYDACMGTAEASQGIR